jgi:hypothetical protein
LDPKILTSLDLGWFWVLGISRKKNYLPFSLLIIR